MLHIRNPLQRMCISDERKAGNDSCLSFAFYKDPIEKIMDVVLAAIKRAIYISFRHMVWT